MIQAKHPINECEVCAAQVEADEAGAIPTAGHGVPAAPDERDKELAQRVEDAPEGEVSKVVKKDLV